MPTMTPMPRALALATLLLVIAISLPLGAVLVFGLKSLASPQTLIALAESVLAGYVLNTVLISLLAGVVALGLGLPSAWMIAAYAFPGRKLLEWSMILPMAMPAYVLAYAYTDALDPSGWLYRDVVGLLASLGLQLPRLDIRSVWGAGIVMGVALSPYVALLAKNAFEERQGAAFDAARAMGLNAVQIFFRLAIPLARPAWIAGLALVVMECFADYGTVAFFSVPTFSTGLFKAWFSYGDRASAAFLGMLMLITMVVLMAFEMRARGGAAWVTSRAGGRAMHTPVGGSTAFLMAMFCAVPGLLGFLFPMYLLVHAAISAGVGPDVSKLFAQALNTISLGLIAVLVILPAAWVCGYALRYGGRWAKRAVRIASAGYAMPGLVIAVGLLAWSGLATEIADRWLDWRLALASTGVLLVGAYLTRFFAVGLGPIESGLGRITRNLEWSASSLGLSRFQVFQYVHFPLMRGATGVAALLIFVDVVKELPATLVLRPFNLETLAVAAHHLAADELLAQAAWPAITMAIVALLPLAILGPLFGGGRRS
ncbi:MAG: iron ABC transporter permease [Burkholderiaceae bacterium]|nr:iron ABC transporter permease [Burkholderiaceae bacterium]